MRLRRAPDELRLDGSFTTPPAEDDDVDVVGVDAVGVDAILALGLLAGLCCGAERTAGVSHTH